MNRREFLAASAVAGVGTLGQAGGLDAAQQAQAEFYELRHYHMGTGAKQRLLNDFLSQVAIPAWNRANVGPVGAFTVTYGISAPSLYVLLPHRDLASVLGARRRLEEDAEYQRAGAAFLNVPLADPAYVRVESSLMRAFDHLPKLELPATTANRSPRIFELRTYESHSDVAARKKIEMFNRGGEIAIFKKVGMSPVFFGETLVGPRMPNLTYMLSFPDMTARDAAWDRFRADPDWRKLSGDTYYADTVSTISDFILRPTAYSQI